MKAILERCAVVVLALACAVRALPEDIYSRFAPISTVFRPFTLRVSNHTSYLILAVLVLASALAGLAASAVVVTSTLRDDDHGTRDRPRREAAAAPTSSPTRAGAR